MGLIKKPSLKGRKRPPRAEKVKPVTIILRNPFNINGVVYGPGQTTVSPTLATALQHQDERAEAAEDKLYEKRAFIVQRKRPPIPVPPDRFGDLLNAVEPFTTVNDRE